MMTFLAMSTGYKEIDYRYSSKNRGRAIDSAASERAIKRCKCVVR